MIVGIDLGTTNSAVAVMDQGGPRILPNALGRPLTPSVVGIDRHNMLLVGDTARELSILYPERCASVFKRYMGTDWSTEIAGRRFTAVQLSSLVLRSLKNDAEAALNGPVAEAVVTVPAYFNEHQRKATIQAAELAGLAVRRILNEPTAAALAYGLHQLGEEKLPAVFDLGGGTFDISVVEFFEGLVEVRASSGENFLGGEDFTRKMASQILKEQEIIFERAEAEHPAMVARLIQQCEQAKCTLSEKPSAVVILPTPDGDCPPDGNRREITREQFEQWIEPILARTEMPIRRCLGDAGLTVDRVDEVILVGGATRSPAVIAHVERLFGKRPQHGFNPEEVVVLGAAVQAGLLENNQALDELVITDVAPFTLGVEVAKSMGTEHKPGYFLPIIHRNTTIPCSRVQRVNTIHANQTEIRVAVFQGESRRVSENLPLGELKVAGLPPGPAGQEVDIRFSYDMNGVLEVEATIVETRQTRRLVITRHAKGLSSQEVERAIQAMQALKTHPRDEAANQYLLRRAERLYRELPHFQREQLAELLDGFEAALELQEPEPIVRYRQALEEFLIFIESSIETDEDPEDDDAC